MSGQGDSAGGIPSWARAGAKVVCVDADVSSTNSKDHNGNMGGLREGATYIIRGVGVSPTTGGATLFLSEIIRGAFEPGFQITRFRPAVPPRSLEQDMKLFTPLLDPPLVRIPHQGSIGK